jgi:hypothetical protein
MTNIYYIHSRSTNEHLSYYISDVFIIVSQSQIIHT